jgi:hypothetical protein
MREHLDIGDLASLSDRRREELKNATFTSYIRYHLSSRTEFLQNAMRPHCRLIVGAQTASPVRRHSVHSSFIGETRPWNSLVHVFTITPPPSNRTFTFSVCSPLDPLSNLHWHVQATSNTPILSERPPLSTLISSSNEFLTLNMTHSSSMRAILRFLFVLVTVNLAFATTIHVKKQAESSRLLRPSFSRTQSISTHLLSAIPPFAVNDYLTVTVDNAQRVLIL